MFSGYYDKLLKTAAAAAKTGQLINDRNSFLTLMEAEKSRIKVPADLASGESCLPGCRWPTFPWGKGQGISAESLL